jgi:excisionase family DNA binding protein
LGIHRDTLRKLAAEKAIPSEQDGPNCKLYFRRSDLDAWRLAGGRPRHLATTLSRAA